MAEQRTQEKKPAKLGDFESWEPGHTPRCKVPGCGGETTLVLVQYGKYDPRWEYECINCGRSFPKDPPKRKGKYARKYGGRAHRHH